jgi:alcohol dehydrogenase YqhD (iron-dependent ADH family)
MRAFAYYCPTEVLFGPEAEMKTAHAAQRHGGSRVLVVYGGESAKKSGLLERVCDTFSDAGLAYGLFGGVRPNPRLSYVLKGVQAARELRADLILGVGGGSVLDAAKAIAHGTANPDCALWDFWDKKQVLTKTLPVGAVVTIPAAGSETSDSSVLFNEETGIKRGLSTPLNYPKFAIMNPMLLSTLPAFPIACGTGIYSCIPWSGILLP